MGALGAEEKIIELPEDIVKNLSKDIKNCYRLIKAITTGEFSEELAKINAVLQHQSSTSPHLWSTSCSVELKVAEKTNSRS